MEWVGWVGFLAVDWSFFNSPLCQVPSEDSPTSEGPRGGLLEWFLGSHSPGWDHCSGRWLEPELTQSFFRFLP